MSIPQTKAMLPLNDGFDMPQFGLVAYRNDDMKEFHDLMVERLEQGIRHIEISDLFGNGSFAVESVLDGDLAIERKDIFITYKIWPKNKKYQQIIDSFRESLHFLGLDYVDLLMIHAPIDITNRLDQWRALEHLKSEGLAKSIGGCNMTNAQLSNLIKVCTVIPAVVEVSCLEKVALIGIANRSPLIADGSYSFWSTIGCSGILLGQCHHCDV